MPHVIVNQAQLGDFLEFARRPLAMQPDQYVFVGAAARRLHELTEFFGGFMKDQVG